MWLDIVFKDGDIANNIYVNDNSKYLIRTPQEAAADETIVSETAASFPHPSICRYIDGWNRTIIEISKPVEVVYENWDDEE